MGVVVIDRGDEDQKLFVNWWNWRPTLEIIRRCLPNVSSKQLELMEFNGGGGALTRADARELVGHLRSLLERLPSEGRIMVDGAISVEPDDGTFYREPSEQHLNYSASHAWLRKLADFCESCDGFYVI